MKISLLSTNQTIKQAIRTRLRKFGFEIQKLPGGKVTGINPFHDMRQLTSAIARPTVFDVGANAGQTVRQIRAFFDHPMIHAFEPASDTFERLRAATKGIPDLVLNNVALGHRGGTAHLIENTESVMSSLLELGPDSWGTVKQKTAVTVGTLDEYCIENAVERIDILKVDTQGFDLEVLRGGEDMLRQGRIGFVLMEIIFCDMYKEQPSLDEIYRFLTERGFSLVSFYEFHYQNDRAGWCDALFASR